MLPTEEVVELDFSQTCKFNRRSNRDFFLCMARS